MTLVKYSTGPVENAINLTTVPGESRTFSRRQLIMEAAMLRYVFDYSV